MKVGLEMALHAAADVAEDVAVTILVTGDEELGSPSSRALIEETAVQAVAVLVLGASGYGGALKTRRKGASTYELTAHGRAAHAGLEPHKGVDAGLSLLIRSLRSSNWRQCKTARRLCRRCFRAGRHPTRFLRQRVCASTCEPGPLLSRIALMSR